MRSRSELVKCPTAELPDDVIAEDVIRVVRLWSRVFGDKPMTLADARVYLHARAEADREVGEENGMAERLGRALVESTRYRKWNNRAIGMWLRRASKYTVDGASLQPHKTSHKGKGIAWVVSK